MLSWDSLALLAAMHAFGCGVTYAFGWLAGHRIGFQSAMQAVDRSRLARMRRTS